MRNQFDSLGSSQYAQAHHIPSRSIYFSPSKYATLSVGSFQQGKPLQEGRHIHSHSLYMSSNNHTHFKPSFTNQSKYNPKYPHLYHNPNHPGYKIRHASDVYPEDIQLVFQEGFSKRGCIYVGNLEAAQSIETLQKYCIGGLLTACKDICIAHDKSKVPYYLYIPGQDHSGFDLSVHFEAAIDFMVQALKQTNVLVHCMAGVSRSVTLVLAFLMRHKNMSLNEAYDTVKRKRQIINPNQGFMRQLRSYQETIEREKKVMRRSCLDLGKNQHESHPLSYSKSIISQEIERKGRGKDLQKKHQKEKDFQFSKLCKEEKTPKTPVKAYPRRGQKSLDLDGKSQEQKRFTLYEGSKPNAYQLSFKGSYYDLNRELDSRIAQIKRKYQETTKNMKGNQHKTSTYYKTHGTSNSIANTYDSYSKEKKENPVDKFNSLKAKKNIYGYSPISSNFQMMKMSSSIHPRY